MHQQLVKNNLEVKRQRNAKKMKVEIARELGEKKATEKTIERTFFRKLYDSKYCTKGDPKVVAQTLKKLKLDSAKRDALKNNIYIRTKGFGWTEFHITVIHNRQPRSIRELSDHLRMIIRKEQDMEIPDKPPVDLLQCCPLPILGTLTNEVQQLDIKYFDSKEQIGEVAKKLRLEREVRGEESGMYAYLQPQEMPTLDELVGERIDVCWPHIVGNNKTRSEQEYEYWWCQGKMIEKVSSEAPPTVKVLCDAMPDL
jgi:hypothetical protein